MKKWVTSALFFLSCILLYGQSDSHIKWHLIKVRDGQQLLDVTNEKTDFTISIKKKVFYGSVGCNQFNGKLEYIEGEMIRPIVLVSTNMACPDYIDGLEYATIAALGVCDKLVFKNDLAEFYNQTRLMVVLKKK